MQTWSGKPQSALKAPRSGEHSIAALSRRVRCSSDAIEEQAECIPLRRSLPIRVGHDQPRRLGGIGLFEEMAKSTTVS